MPVTDVDKDLDALTMTITAEFGTDAERLWELWSDPRQLERWWGPPSHPSTFVEHELTVGARTTYFMTGPGRRETPRPLAYRGGRTAPPAPHDRRRSRRPGQAGRRRPDGDDGDDRRGRRHRDHVDPTHFANRESMEQMPEMGMEQGMFETLDRVDPLIGAAKA
jgi:uncharacterized protein YndB with AHSA1/START domain